MVAYSKIVVEVVMELLRIVDCKRKAVVDTDIDIVLVGKDMDMEVVVVVVAGLVVVLLCIVVWDLLDDLIG